MLGLIKKVIIGLLIGLANRSNHAKCVSLSNQKCMIQPTLINLHPNEYSQVLHYYPFVVKLDRYVGSCNTFNDLSNKVCFPSKSEDLNLSVSNTITGINENKMLTNDILCNCNSIFLKENVIHINGGIMISVDVSVKKIIYVKKGKRLCLEFYYM